MTEQKLRQRIIDKMPSILELMDIENREASEDSEADFRPSIIGVIVRIAKLETTTPSQARRALDRTAACVERLKQRIKELPPSVRRIVKVEVKGLDAARKLVAKKTGRTAARRKLRAADDACSLIFNHGGYVPTLTKDGPYIRLAGLLYYVATGEKSKLESYCRQHFADLKREEIDLYSDKRGPRGSEDSDSYPEQVKEYRTAEYAERVRQRHKAAVKTWPPLEQVVDKVLGRQPRFLR